MIVINFKNVNIKRLIEIKERFYLLVTHTLPIPLPLNKASKTQSLIISKLLLNF